ncbi:MAG: tRNA (adenosine(37)-N6)-threonylcarbamoyltransferase complex dimerization subunit type 1 TsaB [Nitrospiraceae bacterium]|nr:tRNA (adenosine(37)-N6)-threonylcarbamoyltransferase complex dimerization subunit type 1 TsaB [Nitrospiraceae bacterium]
MKILAIDTSTMLGGVAIMDEEHLIAEGRLNVLSTHSERLMTEIEHCLKQAGLNISDIDVFGVTIGPGSFTGIRIGLSTIKGFAYSTAKPIVSIPTLDAFAWNFTHSKYPVCTMLDARRKEVYAALYKWEDNDFRKIMPEESSNPKNFLERVLSAIKSDKYIFAGEGTLLYKDKILSIFKERAVFPSPEKMAACPSNAAYLGLKKALKGDFSEPLTLTPLYIRKSEAELKFQTK